MAIMQEASFDHRKPRRMGIGEMTTESSRQPQRLPVAGADPTLVDGRSFRQ